MQPIVLASSSIYRRELLARLGLPFEWTSPDVDETPLLHETANDLVMRLSLAKAQALAGLYPNYLIIGSDQVAISNNEIIGKPNTCERAFAQLRSSSGKQVVFKTGLCVLDTSTDQHQLAIEEFSVQFRDLSDEQIQGYLAIEKPYDCAGSFKCEGLGIALFSKLEGDDPNSLIGLPLIRLVGMLGNVGIDPLLIGLFSGV